MPTLTLFSFVIYFIIIPKITPNFHSRSALNYALLFSIYFLLNLKYGRLSVNDFRKQILFLFFLVRKCNLDNMLGLFFY